MEPARSAGFNMATAAPITRSMGIGPKAAGVTSIEGRRSVTERQLQRDGEDNDRISTLVLILFVCGLAKADSLHQSLPVYTQVILHNQKRILGSTSFGGTLMKKVATLSFAVLAFSLSAVAGKGCGACFPPTLSPPARAGPVPLSFPPS